MESDAVETSGDEMEKPSSGPDCNCSLFGCFKVINAAERSTTLKAFNSLGNWNDQRPRHNDPKSRDCNFRYLVRVKRNDTMQEIPVCIKAFISLHGIGRRRLETVQSALKEKGQAPKDRRGHNLNKHPCHLSDEKMNAVYDHINSFRGTRSHYRLNKTDKVYLPEELPIKKCYNFYKIKYPSLLKIDLGFQISDVRVLTSHYLIYNLDNSCIPTRHTKKVINEDGIRLAADDANKNLISKRRVSRGRVILTRSSPTSSPAVNNHQML
ncbi:hypothetical protein J6590_028327 [Homalodisca vitripennis]|nr:hypothetical protein J6590_028327 [Homalodisca vitripennis]